jgi:hypothetical protein
MKGLKLNSVLVMLFPPQQLHYQDLLLHDDHVTTLLIFQNHIYFILHILCLTP